MLICSDEHNHASIIDGCRLARELGARVEFFPHADAGTARALLADWAGRAIVVSDAVFSMDGDSAPVEELARACADYDALLVLDEAHSVLSPHAGPLPCEVLRVGTLSKTLGSLGGFVAGAQVMTELLVNRGRPFIFSTALAPADAAAANAALEVLRSAEGAALARRLEGYAAPSGPPLPRRPHYWARGSWYRPYGRRRCPPVVAACGSRSPPPTATTRSACWAKSSGATACGREKAGLSGPA